jgi:DnaJ-domain-containing protein 1
MQKTQVGFVDAEAARKYQKEQDKLRFEAELLKIVGPVEFQRWKKQNARNEARLKATAAQIAKSSRPVPESAIIIDNYLTECHPQRLDDDNAYADHIRNTTSLGERPDLIEAIVNMRAEILATAKPFLRDEYTLLGVERDATKREIKNAYRRKARKLHPDAGGSDEAFKQLHDAYRRVLAFAKA